MLNKFRYILKRKLFRTYGEYDINIEQLKQMQNEGACILDVRSPQEYNEWHLDGSILIPEYELNIRAQKELKDKEKTIIVYCTSGTRSKRAQEELKKKGYKNVYNLYNGIENY